MLELKAEVDDVYDADEERRLMARILAAYYSAVVLAVDQAVKSAFTDVPGFDPQRFLLDDSVTVRLLALAGSRIVRINETTRQAIARQLQVGAERGYSTWQIANGVPSEGYRGINGLFRETWKGRPETVARTELQFAQRAAALERYAATGLVDRVRLVDGEDWDEECQRRNGQVVVLEQAPTLAHPNCTLVLVPILREGIEEQAGPRPPLPAAPSPPKSPEWGEWQTTHDAERAAATRYPHIKFDFSGADIETINPTLRQFDTLAQDYPQVAERLRYFGTYAGQGAPAVDWSRNEWAHASVDGTRIGLNPSWYGDPAKFRASLQQSEAVGWHPKGTNTYEGVITHEFGHQVEHWLRSVGDKIAAQPVVNISGDGLVGTTFYRWFEEHKIGRALSDYGLTSKTEGWAEAFAAQYLSPASVKNQAYVRKQRRLLEALDPSTWRHSADIAAEFARLDGLRQLYPNADDPSRRSIEMQIAELQNVVNITPAGTWQWTRDLPPDERAAANNRLEAWKRKFW